MGRTLYQKLWDDHLIRMEGEATGLLYIDRHLLHEVTTPQAFEGLEMAGRKVWRIPANLAMVDHNVPTQNRALGVEDSISRLQLQTLNANCAQHGITEFGLSDHRQGIVHVVGPEQGFTLPGMTVVCGDSHTSTHGALGALAFGIGTSEVEHVLATQSLWVNKAKTLRVNFTGKLGTGVCAKDMALALIRRIGTAGGTGCVIEFAGEPVRCLSMEARMTLCNMAIEAGARAGMVGVDEVTLRYVSGRPFAPRGEAWIKAQAYWQTLHSDPDSTFDAEVSLDMSDLSPQVTWGTSPEMGLGIDGSVPVPEGEPDPVRRESMTRALVYMGLTPGATLAGLGIDRVFIGSCTNSRIEDLRSAAEVLRGRKVASTVRQVLIVPGSGLVKAQAESEGLDTVFKDAGCEWREPGCSMCVAMNADRLEPGERCASTSNRNFEGRQGAGGRTHLMSPAMAAAAAVKGHLFDFRNMTAV